MAKPSVGKPNYRAMRRELEEAALRLPMVTFHFCAGLYWGTQVWDWPCGTEIYYNKLDGQQGDPVEALTNWISAEVHRDPDQLAKCLWLVRQDCHEKKASEERLRSAGTKLSILLSVI